MKKDDLKKSIKSGHSSNRILQANESYTVEEKVLSALEGIEDFSTDNSIEDNDWELVAKKTVTDFDGFLTEYAWYKNAEDVHIFMLGDTDITEPDRCYADYECETEKMAKIWFDKYTGFDNDEEDYGESEYLESGNDTRTGEIFDGYYKSSSDEQVKESATESIEAYKVTYKDKNGDYPSLIVEANSEKEAIDRVKEKGITNIIEAKTIDWSRAHEIGSAEESIKCDERESTDKQPKEACAVEESNETLIQFNPNNARASDLKEGQKVIFDEDVVYSDEIDTPEEFKDFVRNGILKIDSKTSFLIIPKGTEAVLKYLSGPAGGWPAFYFNNDPDCELAFAGDPFVLKVIGGNLTTGATKIILFDPEHPEDSGLKEGQEVMFDEDVEYGDLDLFEDLKEEMKAGVIDIKRSSLVIPRGTKATLNAFVGPSGGAPEFGFNNTMSLPIAGGGPIRLRIMNSPGEKFSTESYQSSDGCFSEYQLEEALSVIDDCLYKIEDRIIDKLQEVTHIKAAHDALYQSFSDILKIIKKTGVGTELIKKYNLED